MLRSNIWRAHRNSPTSLHDSLPILVVTARQPLRTVLDFSSRLEQTVTGFVATFRRSAEFREQCMPHANRIMGWLACLLAGCLLAAGVASAQRVEGDIARAQGLYEAEVQVYSQREGERRSAFGRGLGQVLARLSGDGDVVARPGVAQELRRAGDYVEHFDYRQDEGTSASGAPTFHTTDRKST